jgi:hypothetical protein
VPQETIMRAIHTVHAFALVILALGAAACSSAPAAAEHPGTVSEALMSCGPEVPQRLAVEIGNALDFDLTVSTGVQVYQCQSTPSGFGWTFLNPLATLVNDAGDAKVAHSGGPTWTWIEDQSSVVATKVDGLNFDKTAIDQLLLKVSSHGGDGKMNKVTFIQRLDTVGGIAPTIACDASNVGEIEAVPYKAHYYFYKASPNGCD